MAQPWLAALLGMFPVAPLPLSAWGTSSFVQLALAPRRKFSLGFQGLPISLLFGVAKRVLDAVSTLAVCQMIKAHNGSFVLREEQGWKAN